MKTKSVNQHDVPAAYLRRFSDKKNHVWCLYNHEFKGWLVEEKSVRAELFTYPNLYDLPNSKDKNALDELIRDELEDKYFDTISKLLNEECSNSKDIGFLALWMYISKYRNVNVKSDWGEFFRKHFRHKLALLRQLNPETEKDLNNYVDHLQMEFYLKTLTNSENIDKFCDLMAGKSWEVLIANRGPNFITNDNPGFSVRIDNGIPNPNTINYNFTIEADSANYYPVSPKHCLHVYPKYNSKDAFDKTPEVYFKEASKEEIEFTNQITKNYMNRYLIAQTEQELNVIKSSM